MPEPPFKLTVVCVLAMVFGLLGLLTATYTVIEMVAGSTMMPRPQVAIKTESSGLLALAAIQTGQTDVSDGANTTDAAQIGNATAEQNPSVIAATEDFDSDIADDIPIEPVGPPDIADIMEQGRIVQESMLKIQNRWFGVLVTILVVQLIVCLVMSIGGLLGIMNKPRARTLLIASFIGVIVLEAGRLAPDYLIQQEKTEVFTEHLDKMMDTVPGNGPKIKTGGVMKFASTVMTIFKASWSVFKMGLFAWFLSYLFNPDVKRYFRIISGEEEFSADALGL